MLRRGDEGGALEWLRAQAGLRPDDAEVRSLLAEALLRAGRKVEGLEELRAAAQVHLEEGRLLLAIAVQKRILTEGAEFLDEVRAAVRRVGPAAPAEPPTLPATPLFGDLEPAELESVVRVLRHHRVAQGSTVVREGDPGDSLFVVVSGALGVTTRDGEKEVELAILRPGDFFGEVALLSGARRTASVRAMLESELLEMRRDVYEEVVACFPRVREVMERFCRDRAGRTVEALRRVRKEG